MDAGFPQVNLRTNLADVSYGTLRRGCSLVLPGGLESRAMTVRVAERRRSVRFAAAYPVTIHDRRGRFLTRCRTANTSENGVFLLVNNFRGLPTKGEVLLEITVPSQVGRHDRRPVSRVVVYEARIVRADPMGHLVGMGLEFLRKLR